MSSSTTAKSFVGTATEYGMAYVPAHTVRIMTIEKGFLRYSWELKAGYWKLSGGSDAAQAVFEISVDGMTYFEHDAEKENVEVR